MNRVRTFVFIVMVLIAFSVKAQYSGDEKVIVKGDPRISELVDLHIAYNEQFPVMDGYRIQLMMRAGNSALDEANEIKEKFEERYPYIKSYITFREPYYLLRIGDFRTRLEAIEFLERIKRNYPQAWVIKDKIEFPELIKYQKTDNYE